MVETHWRGALSEGGVAPDYWRVRKEGQGLRLLLLSSVFFKLLAQAQLSIAAQVACCEGQDR